MTADEKDPEVLVAGWRARVLMASTRARAAGRSYPDVLEISPVEAFGRAADSLNGLLHTLDADDWRRPVVNRFDVQGLIGHLLAVETDVHRCLAGDPDVTDVDHVESTRHAAIDQIGVPPVQTRRAWFRATSHTQAIVDASGRLDTEVAMHRMRVTLGTLLIVRAFELWTHENDIRRAVGRSPSVPDGSTLRLMSGVAATALPLGAARVGLDDPTQVRLVLTGVGGGTWDVAFGADDRRSPDVVAIRIVADAVEFCRLAANRVTPDQVDLHVTGDLDRVDRVLAAVSALALD